MEERKIGSGKLIFITFFLLIVTTILWASFISTKGLIVREYPVYNEKLDSNNNGLKIVHFSDLLVGRTVNRKKKKKVVNKINELNPDIIVFTGNLIDKDTVVSNSLEEYLTKNLNNLEAKLAKYAIYGNQDYKLKNYEIIMKNAGFTILNNTYEEVYYNSNKPLIITGLSSLLKDPSDIQTTLSHINTENYNIILAHEPDYLKTLKDYNPDLVLSGHSLNGQVRLPFIGKIISKDGSKKYYDSYYKVNNTTIYVSGGIGTTDYSYRFFNKPSINFYRLYKN